MGYVFRNYWDRTNNKVNYIDKNSPMTHNEIDQNVRLYRPMSYTFRHLDENPEPNIPRYSPIYYCSPMAAQNIPPPPKTAGVENIHSNSANPPTIVAPLIPGQQDPATININRYHGNPPPALKNYLNKANVKSALQRSGSSSTLLKPTPLNPASVYNETAQNQPNTQNKSYTTRPDASSGFRGPSVYPGSTLFVPLNSKNMASNPSDYILNNNINNDVSNPERCQSCNSVIRVSPATSAKTPIVAPAKPGGLIGSIGYPKANRWSSVAREFQNERLATIQQTTNALRSSYSFASNDRSGPKKYISKYSRSPALSQLGRVDVPQPAYQRLNGSPSASYFDYN